MGIINIIIKCKNEFGWVGFFNGRVNINSVFNIGL